MTAFQPKDLGFAARVRESFAQQTVMATIGSSLAGIAPGRVEILLPYRADLCQQNGFLHAGIVTVIADSAAGYAAFTLYAANEAVLTSELTVHLLSPAVGERFLAVGQVLKPGRRLAVAETEVFAEKAGEARLIAKLIATLVRMQVPQEEGAGP
ncbi:MAG: PaaI family thioesterase [Rhodospirillales bacterium]|nr:PaaI family thioesterase [Rhodospirillales bacterium]